LSFVKCPSCEKTVYLKASQQCPHCGVMLEAEAAPQPHASGDNEKAEYPPKSKMSCLVAGIAAAVTLIGAMVFVIMVARS